jgi:1-acyl-sn-glycerol-3-phosphate acyltransferase
MRLFGGIAVDRASTTGLVEQLAAQFDVSPKMILGIAPEGTRRDVTRWRSGFALIAQAANVPVQPAIVDYANRTITFTALITEIDDADATLHAVQRAASAGRGRNA